MKDKVLDRASGWEGKLSGLTDGKGHEVLSPRPNPGDAVRNRPAKSSPDVKTNS